MKKIYFVLLFIIFLGIGSVDALSTESYIDYPSSDACYGTMMVSGWVMSDDNVDEIKAFIDDNMVDYNYQRVSRSDVVKAFPGYKNSDTPGFNGEVDLSTYNDGLHNLKLEFYSDGKLIASKQKGFSIERKVKMYIDYPDRVQQGKNINIKGWILSNDPIYYFKTYVDDKEIDVDYVREKRDDVLSVVKGYGDNSVNKTPGFSGEISSSSYSSGNHVLKIAIYDSDNNEISFFSKGFYIEKFRSASYIDYPDADLYSGSIKVSGWVMSTVKIDQIKAYIDNNNVDFNYERVKRPDVIKAVSGYGENEFPGYDGIIDLSNYSDGLHRIKLEYLSGNELVKTDEKVLNLKKVGRIYIDQPIGVLYGSNLDIQGWVMTTDSSYVLKTYVDDKEIDVDYIREKRPDVIKAVSGYGNFITNSSPGFKSKVDVSNIMNGSHTLKIDVLDKSNNIITSTSSLFSLNKYDSLMEIDNPISIVSVNGTSINLKGWFLSNFPDAKLQVLIDDVDISDSVKMVNRKDVIKVYGKRFNKVNSDLVGFDFDADLTNIKDGKKEIIFNVINSETGEIINTRKKTINLKKYKTNMDLNEPVIGFKLNGTQLKVRGWFVSKCSSTSLQVLVNDKDISDEMNYVERPDVYNVYGNEFNLNSNDKVGFVGIHDMTEFKDGTVNIKINVINNSTNEIIHTLSRSIKLNKYKTYMDLNDPALNVTSTGTQLNLRGWFLSTSNSKRLQILINDQDVSDKIVFYERPDVYNVYGSEFNLKEDDLVGFRAACDVSTFKDGNLNITINVVDDVTQQIIGTFKRTTKLKKYDGMLTIDYPTRTNFSTTSTLTVQGWELSNLDNSKVKVLIDSREYDVSREQREDVLRVYPTLFGGIELNENPGFTSSISLADVTEGMHKVHIKLYSKLDELITEKSLDIFVYSSTYFGIDVSNHQGVIDWDQVAKSGIDFAILRVGYGSNYTSQDDKQFLNYVEGCTRNKIPYGVYLYSYANTVTGTTTLNDSTASADSEAVHTLRVLDKLNPVQKSYLKLPVFIDMEEDRYTYLGMDTLTAIANKYCDIIQANGYKCGVYANKNWLNNHLNNAYLSSKYDIWLAHYVDNTDYKGVFQIWQYSSSGHLPGINSSGLDMNISYRRYW